MALGQQQNLGGELGARDNMLGHLVDEGDLVQEPRVDAGGIVDRLDRQSTAKSLLYQHDSAIGGRPRLVEEGARLLTGRGLILAPVEARARAFQRAQRLLESLGEVAADRHGLADALHRRSQGWVARRGTSRRRTAAP